MIWGTVRPQRTAVDAQEATGATNAPSVDAGATEPQIGAVISGPTIAPCGCGDEETDRLRDLVANGVGQWEASRRIWGKRT